MRSIFSMASSKRYRILTKDNGVLTVKFASKDEANKYIKQNSLKGAKAFRLGDIRFSDTGEQRVYADILKDFMLMLKECGFLPVKDKNLLWDGFSQTDLILKCPKLGFVGTFSADDAFIITNDQRGPRQVEKTLEIPLRLMGEKLRSFRSFSSVETNKTYSANENDFKEFLKELGFHKPSRELMGYGGFSPDDLIMEFPKLGLKGRIYDLGY